MLQGRRFITILARVILIKMCAKGIATFAVVVMRQRRMLDGKV